MAAEWPLSGYCMLGPKGKVVQKTLPCNPCVWSLATAVHAAGGWLFALPLPVFVAGGWVFIGLPLPVFGAGGWLFALPLPVFVAGGWVFIGLPLPVFVAGGWVWLSGLPLTVLAGVWLSGLPLGILPGWAPFSLGCWGSGLDDPASSRQHMSFTTEPQFRSCAQRRRKNSFFSGTPLCKSNV